VPEAFVCDSVRTPIGRFGGALSSVRPDDLAAHVIRVLVERHPKLDWEALDDVMLGCVNQAGEDNRNVARMALLLAGLPESVPGTHHAPETVVMAPFSCSQRSMARSSTSMSIRIVFTRASTYRTGDRISVQTA